MPFTFPDTETINRVGLAFQLAGTVFATPQLIDRFVRLERIEHALDSASQHLSNARQRFADNAGYFAEGIRRWVRMLASHTKGLFFIYWVPNALVLLILLITLGAAYIIFLPIVAIWSLSALVHGLRPGWLLTTLLLLGFSCFAFGLSLQLIATF